MKKLLICIIAALSCVTALAQLDVGNVLLTGNMSYYRLENKDDNEDETTKNFTGDLRMGFFVVKNLAVGVFADVQQEGTNSFENNTNPYYINGYTRNKGTSLLISGGIFARYYQRLNSRFALFVQLSGGYGKGSGKTTDDVNDGNYTTTTIVKNDFTTVNVSLTPGLTYFCSSKFAIEAMLGAFGYDHQKINSKNDNSSTLITSSNSGLFAGLNLSSISLGISLYLGSPKPVVKPVD